MSESTTPAPRVACSRIVTISVRDADRFGWCDLRFDDRRGFVSIASDFGHWTYHWMPQHRHDSLGHFLGRIDRGYAGGKFLGAGLGELDREATVKKICRHILEMRREGALTREQARDEWELTGVAEESLERWYYETSISDAYELAAYRESPAWAGFWERLWEPLIQPVLREWPEDKAEAEAHERALPAPSWEPS